MSFRTRISTMVAVGAGAVVIALPVLSAPTAQAAPSGPTCTSIGANSTLCQSEGNAQISATPPVVNYQSQYPFFGGYGLLYHHGGDHRG
ncbi:hypothetical protein M1247_11460 [Mycobacterium sp. 21AC1]|uniref:hypothetical protein n=1 Tax=[Mycobacterium] appelbergii TaxID=2939269 RepID=UPI002938FD83|nr:hypothetical protein [Mycobacterium sp. 21AC1]MDV3125532.1 hypothetical protein [Mycobacterium sp. 21AC1]